MTKHTVANQQTFSQTDPPERVASEPVPVPPPAGDADRDQLADDADRNQLADDADRDRPADDTDRDRERGAAEDVTDRVPGDALDDRGSFDDPVLAGERNDPDDLTAVTPGTPEYAEPAPQPTAFGAATLGGAAAAAAQAGPSHEVRDLAEEEGAAGDRDPGVPGPAEQPFDGSRTAPAVDTPAPAVEEPIAGLWGAETAQSYRDRWREVQFRFVDDPPAAAREANQLVEEAVGALTAELSRQKEALRGWSGEDTEDLRAVVRRHRDFLDRLLGL
ncbi:hypothetical protein [Phytohabitans suffuscus]|uniref:Uncharacterized protein n=1 Tax=Phytohabitans suffuscus TaxID=624315 RepID=A0A6F8YMH4_9ACTN|nr:hypothetical protein [Phytohabitans suffuscus]BCB87229.1 hypothetical protein Psuf_045420 [Phytohabitans suffuscus]